MSVVAPSLALNSVRVSQCRSNPGTGDGRFQLGSSRGLLQLTDTEGEVILKADNISWPVVPKARKENTLAVLPTVGASLQSEMQSWLLLLGGSRTLSAKVRRA